LSWFHPELYLINLDDSYAIFETQGKEAFCRYQIEHEDEILAPGYGFSLVKKLLAINESCLDDPLVEVILLSQNSIDTGYKCDSRFWKVAIPSRSDTNLQLTFFLPE